MADCKCHRPTNIIAFSFETAGSWGLRPTEILTVGRSCIFMATQHPGSKPNYTMQPARQNGCRLISLDRPGYGLSDPQPGRSICHWTRDMNEFINATNHPVFLDLQQFSVASFSSGSAYALACAAHLPETRLKSVAVISGVAPLARVCGNGGYSARAYRLAHRFPNFATTLLNRNARQVVRAPKRVIHKISRFFCPPDRKVFCDPLATRMLIESFLDSVRCGPEGVVHDLSLLSQPWGFSNVCINRPVSLWYGSCDLTVPANSMGDYLNRALPNSRLSLIPGEGHISMLKNAGNAVFRQLMLDRTL